MERLIGVRFVYEVRIRGKLPKPHDRLLPSDVTLRYYAHDLCAT